jgi:CheY-like chemotaxis protein
MIDWRRETFSLGLHLLFVDDEVINRNLFERTAKALGCTADVISDGDEVRLLCIARVASLRAGVAHERSLHWCKAPGAHGRAVLFFALCLQLSSALEATGQLRMSPLAYHSPQYVRGGLCGLLLLYTFWVTLVAFEKPNSKYI